MEGGREGERHGSMARCARPPCMVLTCALPPPPLQDQFISRKGFAFNADQPGMMKAAGDIFRSSLSKVTPEARNPQPHTVNRPNP